MAKSAYEGRLDGHRAGITALSFSEDGKKLLTASKDRTLCVWEVHEDTADGSSKNKKVPVASAKRTLRGHSDVVSQAILESGGDFVLSSSWDRTVKLWTLDEKEDEACLRTFRGHRHQVNAVVWSPDHRIILTASCDRTVKVWNNLGECKFTLYDGDHKDWVTALAWSRDTDADYFLSASWDKTVKLWNTKDMKMLWEMKAHTGPVLAVAVSPDSKLGASGGSDRTILVLDLKGRCVAYAFAVDGIIRALDFNPREFWLAAITEMSPSGRVRVFDLQTKTCLLGLSPPDQGLAGLAVKWHPQGRRLFGGFSDGSVHVWRSPATGA